MTFEQSFKRQIKWSKKTFGPNYNYLGIVDHILQETMEVDQEPFDMEEWIDIIILALDGAWRLASTRSESKTSEEALIGIVLSAYESKCKKNRSRNWPDWRTTEPGKAINHIKEEV